LEQIIKISDVKKSYGAGDNKLLVLKGISLEVNYGEFLAILGPSGSGKSTLMNIIGCMDRFEEGEYWLTGEPVFKMNDAQLTRLRNRQIGFIFQKYHLIQKYSVLQNTMMPLLIRGVPRKTAEQISMEKLEMLGMENRAEHKPNELSGGQQQRTAIARALVGSPKLLLADEPTGALDRTTGEDVLKLFQQLNEMGNTIVMITHDLHVAKSAKRIVKIIDGELFEGDTTEVSNE
jgi:putative ABC transport system ATP-binding protein